MKIFSVKKIPTMSWSSSYPLNFNPRLSTVTALCFGLIIFGVGEATLIAAGLGVSPWTVLAQGFSVTSGLSIGWSTFIISLVVLTFWLPLKQMPGIGTILNALIIPIVIELLLPWLPRPDSDLLKIIQVVFGIILVGIGSGCYLISNLGPGPRDGLMTGLQLLTGRPIALVRTLLEISVVALGWLLGGTVGIGTLMFALGIGSAVSLSLYSIKLFFK